MALRAVPVPFPCRSRAVPVPFSCRSRAVLVLLSKRSKARHRSICVDVTLCPRRLARPRRVILNFPPPFQSMITRLYNVTTTQS